MRTILGRIVDTVLVRGLSILEELMPMPVRLSTQAPMPAPRSADPIILVSGFANTVSPGWDQWRQSLIADGFDVYVIDLPTDGLGDMYEAARLVADFIAQVKRRTGRSRVDLLGFSEGGILARMAVSQYGRAGDVDRVITLATPNHGLSVKALVNMLGHVPIVGGAIPLSALQMLEGSKLLSDLDGADAALQRIGTAVRYASVHSTTFDGATTPASAHLAGWPDIAVGIRKGDHRFRLFGFGGPNHYEMYHNSSPAYDAVRALLLDLAVPSTATDPITGALQLS